MGSRPSLYNDNHAEIKLLNQWKSDLVDLQSQLNEAQLKISQKREPLIIIQ